MSEFKFNIGNMSGTMEEIKAAAKKQLDGTHKVPFDEMFPPDFMEKHTQYKTINDLIGACSSGVGSPEWEEHIKKATNFASWKEMLDAGAVLIARSKLGIK